MTDDYRGSTGSRRQDLLRDCKRRGITAPCLLSVQTQCTHARCLQLKRSPKSPASPQGRATQQQRERFAYLVANTAQLLPFRASAGKRPEIQSSSSVMR